MANEMHAAAAPRLKQIYAETVRQKLIEEFGYKNLMQVPTIENGQVFLVHFKTLDEANAHFLPQAGQWQELKKKFRKAALENVFRTKGWTVK